MVHQLPSRRWGFDHQLVDAGRVLACVELGHTPNTQQNVGVAPQHQLLQRAHPPEVARLCRPKDALSQVANDPISFPPVDGVPVGTSHWSVCRAEGLHPTFPLMSNRYGVLWVVHQVHVSRFSAWATRPYPPGYDFPVPFGGWRSLLGPSCVRCRIGLPLRSADWPRPDGNGVATFHIGELRWGWVPSLPRGRGV